MQLSINSANILTFRVGVLFDIYNRKVTFSDLSTYAGSSGSGRFNVQGISFYLEDQQGVKLTDIDFSDVSKYIVPGSQTEFELDLSSLSYPFLFQTYQLKAAIKDQDGTVYTTVPVYKNVCQPQNFNDNGYVDGIFQVSVNCPDNVLTVKDITPLVYNNQTPASTTRSGNLYYPTGTISSIAFTGTPFSNNTIYDGQYRVVCTTGSEYDLEDDVSVLVTYLTNNVFNVTCTNKIADLICCMTELQDRYLKNCNNAQGKAAKQALDEVSVPFLLGLTKEINGQDASTEAALIRKTLRCNCGETSLRQNQSNPINPSVTNIVLSGGGGTTIPSPVTSGNTKTYSITSSIYQVVKGNTGDLAFTIDIDTATTNVVKYKITFNYNTMASYILSAISSDSNLIAVLNSLVSVAGNVDLSGLDGKCVINLASNTYFLTQNVTANTKIVKFSTLTDFATPTNLYASNASAVQTWLNGLGVGTYTVNYNAGVFSVLSTSNTDNPSSIEFSNPDLTVPFQTSNATLVSVLQAVIDYLCTLTALKITLGNTITLWQIDYNGNAVSQSFETGVTQAVLNQGIADSIYNIVQNILNLTGVTCTKIKSIFSDSSSPFISSTDRIYGTLNGACASLTDKQIATLVIAAINYYPDVKDQFCKIDCSSPATCPEIVGIRLSMIGNNIGVYGVTFFGLPVAAQTLTVRYKRSDASTYTTVVSNLVVFPNGTINGTTPFQIGGLTAGVTYDVQVVNNCGGSGAVQPITVPTGSAYSGSYLVDNILYMLCGNSPVTYYTGSPFAVGVTVYADAGLTTPLTGYSYIADYNTGEIYTINPSTGEVTADTGSSCSTGVANDVKLSVSLVGSSCKADEVTVVYTNGVFEPGKTLYVDSALTTPLTGYAYVNLGSNNKIFELNSITGVIGIDTGVSCSVYEQNVRLDNTDPCAVGNTLVYTTAYVDTGVTLYLDSGFTTPVTGYNLMEYGGIVYNINSVTGVVGSVSGTCTPP
ncbi:MAG TPA: hypothetical protein PKI55_04165 [Chitinophagaceae bacterium]|nr:hypothetical protein [Chitinophagaceae bacterium]